MTENKTFLKYDVEENPHILHISSTEYSVVSRRVIVFLQRVSYRSLFGDLLRDAFVNLYNKEILI